MKGVINRETEGDILKIYFMRQKPIVYIKGNYVGTFFAVSKLLVDIKRLLSVQVNAVFSDFQYFLKPKINIYSNIWEIKDLTLLTRESIWWKDGLSKSAKKIWGKNTKSFGRKIRNRFFPMIVWKLRKYLREKKYFHPKFKWKIYLETDAESI